MLNNFVSNLIIENVKKKNGGPARQLTNKRDVHVV
jgi:hypothetical protein